MGSTLRYCVGVDHRPVVLVSGLPFGNRYLWVLKTLQVVEGRRLSRELHFFFVSVCSATLLAFKCSVGILWRWCCRSDSRSCYVSTLLVILIFSLCRCTTVPAAILTRSQSATQTVKPTALRLSIYPVHTAAPVAVAESPT